MAGKRKGALSLLIISELEGRGLKEAIKDTKKLGAQMQSLSGQAIKAAAAFAAFKVGGALATFGKESVEQATQLERGLAGLGAIFQQTTPQMVEFTRNASQIGLSMTEATEAATFLGSVVKQAGFSIDETADMTQRLINLAADLAITYQKDVSEALTAIAALFRGEYDPIEKFGVGMKQNEIESLKAERGLEKLTGRAEIFADVMIRFEQLFIRSADAQGAFARQSESLYVQQQVLAASIKNVQGAVGLALTPALAELTAQMVPLVENLTPLLIGLFKSIIPVIESLTANKDRLAKQIFVVISFLTTMIKIFSFVATAVINNIELFKNLAIAIGALVIGVRVFGLMTTAIKVAADAVLLLNGRLLTTVKRLGMTRAAIARTGFGLIALAIGAAAVAVGIGTDKIAEDAEAMGESFEDIDWDALYAESANAQAAIAGIGDEMQETAGAAGELKDAVGDFYRGLAESAAKQSAKLQLQAMGASEGLINAVLGSGEEWYKVFAHVTRNGLESLREVQAMFMQTTEGFDEAMSKWQEEFDAFQEFKKQALEAKDAFVEFVTGFKILPTVSRQLGKFEQAAVDQLASVKEKLKEAFDNGYLLEESYRNLLKYAREEFAVLRGIERQRDEILARRDAAAALIESVSDSVRQGARLVGVLQSVQNETEKVDVAKIVKNTIQDANNLREFEVIVTSAVIEPIEEIKNRSQQLVQGYRDIVERTRNFVQNMKELRALGLDPVLFQQLVEAGVDAGGATAEALIEGGADTVNEVNSLFGELNDLGEQLGNETAEVMYGQGESFVDGIVQGLTDQAKQLEKQAKSLAKTFTTTFEDILISGIEAAIKAAEKALSKMPRFEGQPDITTPTGPTGPTGPNTPTTPPLAPGYKPDLGDLIFGSKPLPKPPIFNMPVGAGSALNEIISGGPTLGNPYKDPPLMYGATVNINASRIDSRSLSTALSRTLTNTGTSSSRSSTSLRIP